MIQIEREKLERVLEALKSALSDDQPYIVKCGKAIANIEEALAQPEIWPDEISTDELIYMSGRQEGMKQERALWELSKLGQEIEAQPQERNFCPRCGKRTADLATVHTCTPPRGKT